MCILLSFSPRVALNTPVKKGKHVKSRGTMTRSPRCRGYTLPLIGCNPENYSEINYPSSTLRCHQAWQWKIHHSEG